MDTLVWSITVHKTKSGTHQISKSNKLTLDSKAISCKTDDGPAQIKVKDVKLYRGDGEISLKDHTTTFALKCKNVSEQEQQRLEAFLDAVGAAKQAKDRSSSAYSFKPVNNLNQGRFRVAAAGIIAQTGSLLKNRTRMGSSLRSPPPSSQPSKLDRQVDSMGSSLSKGSFDITLRPSKPDPPSLDIFEDQQFGQACSSPATSHSHGASLRHSSPSRPHTPPPTRPSGSSSTCQPLSPFRERRTSSNLFSKASSSAPDNSSKFSTPRLFDSELRRPNSSHKEALSLLDSGGKTRLQGALEGLANLGNTCYMNAVLQSLFAVPSFFEDLLSSTWCSQMLADVKQLLDKVSSPDSSAWKSKEKGATYEVMEPRLCTALLRVILLYKRKDHGVIDPSAVKKAMGFYFRPYAGRNQQDAHEFLGDLLNTLHEEMCPYGHKIYRAMAGGRQEKLTTALTSSNCSNVMSIFQSPPADSGEDLPSEMSEEETAFLGQILPVTRHFQAEVAVTLTCTRCSYSRSRVEVYHNFSIDLPEGKGLETPLKLEKLFDKFFADEELELACEKCGHNEVKAVSRVRRLPAVLVVHIKRFKIDGTNNLKLTTKVKAPTQLDLSKLCDKYTRNADHHMTALGPQIPSEQVQFLVQDVPYKKNPPAERTPNVGTGKAEKSLGDHMTPLGTPRAKTLRQHIDNERSRRECSGLDRWADKEDDTPPPSNKRRSPDPTDSEASPTKKTKPAIILDEPQDHDAQIQEAIRRSLVEKEQQEKEAELKEAEELERVIKLTTPVGQGKENMCPNQERSILVGRSPYDLQHFRYSKELRVREDKLRSKYELKSVIRHIGKWAFSGHYIADVRMVASGEGQKDATGTISWTRKDDSVVSTLGKGDEILDEDVSLETGYLFFYTIQYDGQATISSSNSSSSSTATHPAQ